MTHDDFKQMKSKAYAFVEKHSLDRHDLDRLLVAIVDRLSDADELKAIGEVEAHHRKRSTSEIEAWFWDVLNLNWDMSRHQGRSQSSDGSSLFD